MNRSGFMSVIAASAFTLVAATTGHAQVLSNDFEGNYGWYVPNPGGTGITTSQYYSATHSFYLDASNNLWTPILPYSKGQFVEVTYRALSPTGSQTAATPSFGNGLTLLQPGTQWTQNKYIFRAEGGSNDRMQFFSPNAFNLGLPGPHGYIDDVTLQPVTHAQAVVTQDANFATLMPQPFNYTAPSNRQALIPNAMNRLATGQSLRVTMVGDSIINDTYSTAFEGLVERRTGGTLNVTAKTANGSGSTYWASGNHMQEVMATNPDLLLWGGISQFDIPSLRSVIQQARAVNPGIEIVLMSPIAGNFNPFIQPEFAQPANPANTGDYRNDLIALATEQNVQYWDLTTPWSQYILGSGLAYSDFLRDGVHMSGRAELLTGRLMEAYFTPVPEPASLLLTGLAFGAGATLWRRKRRKATELQPCD